MTEKAVASSDATNITSEIVRSGDGYEVKGLKWWTSGAMDPRCRVSNFDLDTTYLETSSLQEIYKNRA